MMLLNYLKAMQIYETEEQFVQALQSFCKMTHGQSIEEMEKCREKMKWDLFLTRIKSIRNASETIYAEKLIDICTRINNLAR